LISDFGVFDRLCVEGVSVADEVESEELGITFGVEAEDFELEGPATGSTGSENPENGADDADSWGIGVRLSTTGYLLQLPAVGRPGSSGLAVGFCDSSTEVGVANSPNGLELAPASPDARDGIGAVEESWSRSFRGGGIVGLNPIHFVEGPVELPVAVGVGVELAARVGSTGGGADDVTRPPKSGSRGEKATGVAHVTAALAERGFIRTAPFRLVGSAMRFFAP